ncbi:hypothetical protein [Micromonospora sp. LOL_023]|uniref:hypothetical protein n=1 Tax=Micromonospora sp. LOL_023 TaxID=3345418 RepID=UPI003A892703
MGQNAGSQQITHKSGWLIQFGSNIRRLIARRHRFSNGFATIFVIQQDSGQRFQGIRNPVSPDSIRFWITIANRPF